MVILYRFPLLYHGLMSTLYGADARARYEAVAGWVLKGTEVLDVCCGDGTLSVYLDRSIRYRGLDQSAAMVRRAQRLGRNVQRADLRTGPIPDTQIIVCQSSLYQFHPDEDAFLVRLLAATRQRLILSEPVQNLSQSRWPALRRLAAWATRAPGMDNSGFRFTPERLKILLAPYQELAHHVGAICNGREWLVVLDKTQ